MNQGGRLDAVSSAAIDTTDGGNVAHKVSAVTLSEIHCNIFLRKDNSEKQGGRNYPSCWSDSRDPDMLLDPYFAAANLACNSSLGRMPTWQRLLSSLHVLRRERQREICLDAHVALLHAVMRLLEGQDRDVFFFLYSCEEKPVRNDDNHIVTSDDLLVFQWSLVNAHSMVYLVPNIRTVLCI